MLKIRGLTPVIATEIEFYLSGAGKMFSSDDAVLEMIAASAKQAGASLYAVEKERGREQFEIALNHSADMDAVISATEGFKQQLTKDFAAYNVQADFSAKPLPDQPGSGLHVHVHLEDATGKNVFFREEDEFCPRLLHSVAGLLSTMNASMAVFAPYEASYRRFVAGSNAPTTVSWGTNNRTVAIRLPDKPLHNKHLEHRVAGSDADIAKVIEAILAGIEYGIHHQLLPPEPVYGDASLLQYGCAPLAKSLTEALSLHRAA